VQQIHGLLHMHTHAQKSAGRHAHQPLHAAAPAAGGTDTILCRRNGCCSMLVAHTGLYDTEHPCCDTNRHSTAQHSTAQHRTAQHSTAQHSTAQHSTAQHSTAQSSPWADICHHTSNTCCCCCATGHHHAFIHVHAQEHTDTQAQLLGRPAQPQLHNGRSTPLIATNSQARPIYTHSCCG